MGPLADWDARMDILIELCSYGMEDVVDQILGNLSSPDLRMVRLVCSGWMHLVERITSHREIGRLGWGWSKGEPSLGVMQCHRERSVCTVTAMSVDEHSIAAGLGSYGKIEVWNRRSLQKELLLEGHKEGVYSIALGKTFIFSAGQDSVVRVWSRKNGDEIAVLTHHTYIVWSVKLWLDRLVTASYDCTVCYLKVGEGSEWSCEIEHSVQGPWEWADALFLEENGEKLVVQDENIFELSVWDVKSKTVLSRLQGHTDEVHSVSIRGYLIVSGGADKTVRLWDWRTADCLSVLEGHEGKVWSVTVDRFRIASGGRHGEVRLWNLQDYERQLVNMDSESYEDENSNIRKEIRRFNEPAKYTDGRVLFYHPRSTNVASIHIDRLNLVTADGLATVLQWDFWTSQLKTCPCTKYKTSVPDPLFL
eukprot:GFUD01045666.1.p1 GENE.GFUD01045666.1~~GFUD01045666.1.p1  ORF type:complete len:420 (-),score=61.86 GFUD01045666.1:156-1415(-)